MKRSIGSSKNRSGFSMQLSRNVHMLRLPFTISVSEDTTIERAVNIFIVTGPSVTLIDAGVAGSKEKIFGYLRSIGRDPEEIGLLILTHSHPDHVGGAHEILQETGCEIAAHAGERAWIEDVNLQCRERPIPGFHSLVSGSVPVARSLEDGDVLELGPGHDLDCVVFHTPGHSQGSVSLFLNGEGALFTGDAVPVPGGIPVYDDVLASAGSVRRLMKIDGIHTLLSAWDCPAEGILAYQQLRRSLAYLQQVHSAVLSAASDCPADLMDLCRRTVSILGLPPDAATPLLARTFSAHLLLCNRPRLLIDEDALSDDRAAGGPGTRKSLI